VEDVTEHWIGWIGKKLFKQSIDHGLSHFQAYLKEEGMNLLSFAGSATGYEAQMVVIAGTPRD
jgi:hypothetical protein